MFSKILRFFRRRSSLDRAIPPSRANSLVDVCRRASHGDLEARAVGYGPTDPLSPLAKELNLLLDVFDAYVRETRAAMNHCSEGQFHRPILLRGMPGAFRESARVINRAAMQMRQNAQQLAAAETSRKNVLEQVRLSVGAACEELSNSAAEISRQAGGTVKLTTAAVHETEQAAKAVAELGKAAEAIKPIVTLITDIARETNLLALNATIEAARAGEHGRGFAIVANEVKKLSQNTATATSSIDEHVTAIHQTTANVQKTIETFCQSIRTIDTSASVIATSVTEQVQATGEISHRIADISRTMESPKDKRASNPKPAQPPHRTNTPSPQSHVTGDTLNAARALAATAEV